jgi:hypothetical protein
MPLVQFSVPSGIITEMEEYYPHVALARIDSALHKLNIELSNELISINAKIRKLMLVFSRRQSVENTQALLHAWNAILIHYKKALAEITDIQLREVFHNECYAALLEHNNKIYSSLTAITNAYKNKSPWLAKIEAALSARVFSLISHNKYALQHRIAILRQSNPVIMADVGYCFAISLASCYDILQSKNDRDLLTVADISGQSLQRLAKIKDDYDYFLDEDSTNPARTQLMTKLHIFAKDNNTTKLNAKLFAKQLAQEITRIFSNIEFTDKYAVELSLYPRYYKNLSHSLGLVVKNSRFYLIDSNTGIYSFASLSQLQNFVAWYLNIMGWSMVFSTYSITNYPHMEHEYPLPAGMHDKAISYAKLLELKVDSGIKAAMVDGLKNLRWGLGVVVSSRLNKGYS